jgi:hypothetical protein
MRDSEHDIGIYLCSITGAGLQIGEPLDGVTGTLGWTALTDALRADQPASSSA